MDVLVLGGTVFLGRAVVAEAQAAGAKVTVFNRGQSGPAPDGAEQITGDRTVAADLEQLAGRHFDVVVDTSGYVPVDVARSAELLAPSCDYYAFVSTINVFPGWPTMDDYHEGGVHAGDPDATRDDAPKPDEAYGWLKAGCEQAVVRAFGAGRSSMLRAGCIVGPDDTQVGRLSWWIDRVGRGGEVLAPGAPDDPVAVIDSRDLARFALARPSGAFEVTGDPVPRRELLAAAREVTGSDATFTWVDTGWLTEQDVDEWTEIPLWANEPSTFGHDNAAAKAAGLPVRPVERTIADMWAWQQSVPGGWRPAQMTPGLDPDKEQQLLKAWRAR
jgi:nucleoside-diphosphate-sugar epimerase